uniref:Uncharacterized protein n=1 Tax=Pseudomonas aeruginosa TaxID=287 RepID=A0A6C0L559_PSEAI|nr:hypothetical protein [Pseudomonas aeruginosa]
MVIPSGLNAWQRHLQTTAKLGNPKLDKFCGQGTGGETVCPTTGLAYTG